MKKFVLLLLLALGFGSSAWAETVGDAVEVEIRSDNGGGLPLYPVAARYPNHKVYAEAVKGDQYSIHIRNRLNRRIGVVIAVDGRNIVSGKKSWLKSDERMYILEPYGAGNFSGWRADLDRVNRFYFTSAADSYATAFGDESAMGVIAVAVYPEVQRFEPEAINRESIDRGGHRLYGAAPKGKKAAKAPAAAPGYGAPAPAESAGTGYGREEYEPTQVVAFERQANPIERIYIKYEWRSTLCRLGIIPPPRPHRHHRNRLWDDGGFAPPPPGKG